MRWETIIGIEVHAELNTKTKIFCGCSTHFGAAPNENICPVCLGLPGTLPVLNEEVVNIAIKAGLALNCEINLVNKMDRKNYFYPDLPKAYQISQFDLPICKNGHVDIEVDGVKKKIRINRIHIEEDAGKLVHSEDEPVSFIDYNRVGVPLVEIVSEADMRSPQEAVAYVKALKAVLEYAEISDCRMEQGSLRCDANISIRPFGQEAFNSKVEIKNMNSFKELQKAMEKEEKRQSELYSYGEGHKVVQETRRWDSGKGRTISMRSKEDAHDYRYFPEPDLTPIFLKQAQVEAIQADLPELPSAKTKRFIEQYQLTEKEVDILVGSKALAEFYEGVISKGAAPKTAANWLLGDLLKLMKEKEEENIPLNQTHFVILLQLIDQGEISLKIGREVFEEMFLTGKAPQAIIEEKGLTQISGENALLKIVEEIMTAHPQSLEDYYAGKIQALGFLMGQVMKATKGQANPLVAKALLEKKLKEKVS